MVVVSFSSTQLGLAGGFAFLSMITVLGNLVVLLSMLKARMHHDLSRFLVLNLALTDFLLGIVQSCVAFFFLSQGGIDGSSALCRSSGSVGISLACQSVLSLTVIALDRYFAIVRHAKLSRRTVYFALTCCWVYSMLMGLGGVYPLTEIIASNGLYCTADWTLGGLGVVFTFWAMGTLGVAMCVIVICYYKVFGVVRTTSKNAAILTGGRSQEFKLAKKMFIIVAVFFINLIPYSIAFAFGSFFHLRVPLWFDAFATYGVYGNSAINPLLYALLDRRYRAAFISLLTCAKRGKHCVKLHRIERISPVRTETISPE